MKRRRVTSGKRVQARIDRSKSDSRRSIKILIQKGEHRGERRCRCRSSSHYVKVAAGIPESIGAGGNGRPIGTVFRADKVSVMICRRADRDVRHVALAVGRNSSAGLPPWLDKEGTGSAAGCRESTVPCDRRRIIVPCLFPNVLESRRNCVARGSGRGPVGRVAARRIVARVIGTIPVEFSTARACHFRDRCGNVDCQSQCGRRSSVAIGRARVARRRRDGLTLAYGLLGPRLIGLRL